MSYCQVFLLLHSVNNIYCLQCYIEQLDFHNISFLKTIIYTFLDSYLDYNVNFYIVTLLSLCYYLHLTLSHFHIVMLFTLLGRLLLYHHIVIFCNIWLHCYILTVFQCYIFHCYIVVITFDSYIVAILHSCITYI